MFFNESVVSRILPWEFLLRGLHCNCSIPLFLFLFFSSFFVCSYLVFLFLILFFPLLFMCSCQPAMSHLLHLVIHRDEAALNACILIPAAVLVCGSEQAAFTLLLLWWHLTPTTQLITLTIWRMSVLRFWAWNCMQLVKGLPMPYGDRLFLSHPPIHFNHVRKYQCLCTCYGWALKLSLGLCLVTYGNVW